MPYQSMVPAAIDVESARKIPLRTALDENVPKVTANELVAVAEPAGVNAVVKPN